MDIFVENHGIEPLVKHPACKISTEGKVGKLCKELFEKVRYGFKVYVVNKDKEGNTTIIELMGSQNVYKAKIAASDGSFNKEVTLTDSDLKKIDALPDVDDI